MKEVKVITLNKSTDLTEKLIQEILSYEVVVLRNFDIVHGIKSSCFLPANLAKEYGDNVVDIVT